MNHVPVNLLIAEAEAANQVAEKEMTEREKLYKERNDLCASLQEKGVSFNCTAPIKELKKLLGANPKNPAKKDEAKGKKEEPEAKKVAETKMEDAEEEEQPNETQEEGETEPKEDDPKAKLNELRAKAKSLGIKPPRLYTMSEEKLEAEIKKLESK